MARANPRRTVVAMRKILLLLPLLVAGCAAVDCGSDWFAVGQSDGRINAGNQAERYAGKCPGIDTGRYGEGYRDGFAQRPTPSW